MTPLTPARPAAAAPAVCRQFSVHGLGVELACELPYLDAQNCRALAPFEVAQLPDGFTRTAGTLRAYDQSEVMRSLSPSAVPVSTPGQLLELYQEGERFWMVDDRWGLCEVNVMKGTWRSWVLPRPTLDAVRVTEMAVLWPLAQLLRPRGLFLLNAAAAARGRFGLLLIAPFNLEGELRTLVEAGYNLVGQRWVALREEDGRIDLLHMPGLVEREYSPRLRQDGGGGGRATSEMAPHWLDLAEEYVNVDQPHAYCDAVMVVEPGRRPTAHASEVTGQRATGAIRRAWPITELHPFRKYGQLPMKLAHTCRCWQAQLSRRPEDLLVLLDSIRTPHPAATLTLPSSAALSPAPAGRPLRMAM